MIEIVVAGSARPALVDDDFAHLQRYRWRISNNWKGVVFRYGEKRVKLSHAIAGVPPRGFGVVHDNGDLMDFRRFNLIFEPMNSCWKRGLRKRKDVSPGQGDLFVTYESQPL